MRIVEWAVALTRCPMPSTKIWSCYGTRSRASITRTRTIDLRTLIAGPVIITKGRWAKRRGTKMTGARTTTSLLPPPIPKNCRKAKAVVRINQSKKKLKESILMMRKRVGGLPPTISIMT